VSSDIDTNEPLGALFVVSTPIGNLGDISTRAVHVLGIADLIACEDTRRTRRLLNAVGVAAPELMRLDAHTEHSRADAIVERLGAGQRVAVVSDAGTPGVSDPGSLIVGVCVAAGHRVVPIPGASAALAALVVSGLATDRFTVEGFLPRKGKARAERLAHIAANPATSIVYESPNRIAGTLSDLVGVCDDGRRATVARELTKLHEELSHGTLAELAEVFESGTRGEVVIVIGGAPLDERIGDEVLLSGLADLAKQGHSRSRAVSELTRTTGESKRRIYELALSARWGDIC